MDISVIKNDQMLSYPSTFLDIKQWVQIWCMSCVPSEVQFCSLWDTEGADCKNLLWGQRVTEMGPDLPFLHL